MLLPASAEIPINLTSMWAWDAPLGKWYFHAPNQVDAGTLSSYITSIGYLDFGTKPLDPAMAFWINKP